MALAHRHLEHGRLTQRLGDTDDWRAAPASPAMIVPIGGTGTGAARAVPSAGGAMRGVRMDGAAVHGFATAGGASGDVVGGLRFLSDGGGDVTCGSARWSMGRVQP